MKKSLILTSLLFICILANLSAETVKEVKARVAAQNWYRHYAPENKKSASVARFSEYKHNERTAFYIYNFDQGGFVLVSANGAVTPILGYGFDHPAPDEITNEAVKGWFDNYARQIDTAFVLNLKNEEMSAKWQEVLENKIPVKNGKSVGPLLTTTWDQVCYYNEMCPIDSNSYCGHVPAGCTATAMAQIMKYYNYPEGGTGQHDYVGKYHPEYGRISAFFNETDYNWLNMPPIVNSHNLDVATLLFHCGVASNMDYSPSGSGAYENDARIGMNKYFNYSDSMAWIKRQYNNNEIWNDLLKHEINNNRPILYVGYNSYQSLGHAFVCDGFDSNDFFHMNWGWSGSGNGYWLIDNLTPGYFNFNYFQRIVTGIKPKYSPLKADFEIRESDSLLKYNFIDFSTGNPDSCHWNFGDGDSSYSRNPIHHFDSAGIFNIQIIAFKNSLTDTLRKNVNIFSKPFIKTTQALPLFEGDGLFFDYDNDGDLDILTSGYPSGTLLHRNDNDVYIVMNIGIPFVYPDASIDIGDYDNDGDLDIIICGEVGELFGIRTKLYRNDNGIFTEIPTIFFNASGTVSFVDYNNDGKLDIFLAGSTGFEFKTGLYKNLGDEKFKEIIDLPFPLWGQGVNAAWSDIDNDGYQDVIICGAPGNWDFQTKVFHNNGNDTFTEINRNIVGVNYGKIAFGDYDSDGDQDFLITGGTGLHSATTVLYTNESSYFSGITYPAFDSLSSNNASWGDFDGDGDLDLLLGINLIRNDGNDLFEIIQTFEGSHTVFGDYNNDSKLDILSWGQYPEMPKWECSFYRNSINSSNQSPSIPNNLYTETTNNQVKLSWNPSVDNTTDINSISYSIRVGKTIYGSEIMSPTSSAGNGYNMTVNSGNARFNSNFLLNNLPNGKYYWSVQAIDNGFLNSSFSVLDSFNISGVNLSPQLLPFTKSSHLNTFFEFKAQDFYDNYADPENDSIYSIKIDSLPIYGNLFLNDTAITVSQIILSSQISKLSYYSSVWSKDYFYYNVSDGNNWSHSNEKIYLDLLLFKEIDQNLAPTLSVHAWGDFNMDGYLDISSSDSIYKNDYGVFHSIGIELSGSSDLNWGDIDGDGDFDLISGSKIYSNNSNNQFTLKGRFYQIQGDDAGTFADFNNDNNLDYLHSGDSYNSLGYLSKIYLNNGQGYFNDSIFGLLGFRSGSVACGDYDNDGDQDLVISGISNNGRKTIIYRNDNGQFTDINANLPGVNVGSLEWGDYDNDGDLDLLISGTSGSIYDPIINLFRNDNGHFFYVWPNYWEFSIFQGEARWFDYDGDGYLDIFASGFSYAAKKKTLLFRNLNGNGFEEKTNTGLPKLSYASIAIGDYNNDGYQDLILSGKDENEITITKVFRNCYSPDTIISNTAPSIPLNLQSIVLGQCVHLQWDKCIDNSTPQNALSYNIYVRKSSDSSFVVSPMADTITGFRKIVHIGNTSLNNYWNLKDLGSGTYFWSVQAIDNSFMPGSFAPEQSFTIVETLDTLGIIAGDTIVCQGQSNVTYSIPQINNVVSYEWILPNGVTGSSTTNIINVNFSNLAVSGNITVKGYNSCGDDITSSLPITINTLPQKSGIISGQSMVCQSQSNIIYSIPNIPNAISYIWTLPNGVTGSSLSNNISVNIDSTATSGLISVKGQNSCGNGESSYFIISIKPKSDLGAISGLNTVCIGQDSVIYSIPNPTIVYDDWFLPSIDELSLMYINLHSYGVGGFAGGWYHSSSECSEYHNWVMNFYFANKGCTSKEDALFTRAIRAFNSSEIFQLRSVGPAGGFIFHSINNENGSYTYYEAAPTDLSTAAPWGGCVGTFLGATGTAIGTGMLNTLIIVNGCNTIGNAAQLCENYSISIPSTWAVPLTWTAPADWIILSGQGTTQITVKVGTNNGNVSVVANNSCGNLTVSSLPIAVNQLPINAGAIFGSITVCQGQNAVTYTVPVIANASSHIWTLPNGATGNSTTNSISVIFTDQAVSGEISVKGVNDCGEGEASALYIQIINTPAQPSPISGNSNPNIGSNYVYTVINVEGVSYEWTTTGGSTIIDGQGTNAITVVIGSSDGTISVTPTNNCGSGIPATLEYNTDCGSSWIPLPNLQYNMQIVAQILINGQISLNPKDVLGAFVGNECRGIGSPDPALNGKIFLTVSSNLASGEQIEFKIWNSNTCNECNAIPGFEFVNQAEIGTFLEPYQVRCGAIQNLSFGQGYTWFSLNVNPGSMSPNSLFTTLTPCYDDRVIGQTSFALFTGSSWVGSLTSLGMDKMYRMKLCSSQSLSLMGEAASLNPINLAVGYTWLGYQPQQCQSVGAAMAGLSPGPSYDDRVIGQSSFALFTGSTWVGSLTQMCPGKGYVVKLANAQTLTYPAPSAKSSSGEPQTVELVSPTGIYPSVNHQHTMMVVAKLQLPDGMISLNEKDVVYAYINGEVRGIGNPMSDADGAIFLSIADNEDLSKPISFRVWLDERQQLLPLNESLSFEPLAAVGELNNPFIFTLGEMVGVNEMTDGIWIGEPYPNPFTTQTVIPILLTTTARTSWELFNSLGQKLRNKEEVDQEAGINHILIDRVTLLPGVYVLHIQVQSGEQSQQKQIRLIVK